ncbi:MAG: PTS sugar transporter [Firmicutes bacterium HGW-Firmicutes-10]|jgi:mannitol/fructose-specific phosphotransferase system IIA component|nr:MAG: PTS sugar transporter [Firmicutes bacterium HGW-Firmicutes-10]
MKFSFKSKKTLPILMKENIIIEKQTMTTKEAIDKVGAMMVKSGYVKKGYIDGMHRRDEDLSVFLGNLLAIPHGVHDVKDEIIASGMVVLIVPDGIDWHGNIAKVIVGLAGKDGEHMSILANLATTFEELETAEKLVESRDVDFIYQTMTQ